MEDKIWYNAAYINKIELVFSLYPQLGLSSEQFIVVLAILWQQKNNEDISIESLCRQTKLTPEKVNRILVFLSEKGYLVIKTRKNKVEFSLEGVFQEKRDSIATLDANLFSLFEQEFGRILARNELQMLADLKQRYPYKEIVQALRQALIYDKRSMNYVAKILANRASGQASDE